RQGVPGRQDDGRRPGPGGRGGPGGGRERCDAAGGARGGGGGGRGGGTGHRADGRQEGPRQLPGGAVGRSRRPRRPVQRAHPAGGRRRRSGAASVTTAIVVVSHSAQIARGVCEVAAQMAPDVPLRAAGGTVDGRIGTSFDKVLTTVVGLTEEPAEGVVVLTDLGSATMTAESVLEMVDDERVVLADAPLVEGAIAAAVAAQGGADPTAVRRAAEEAAASFPGAGAAGAEES